MWQCEITKIVPGKRVLGTAGMQFVHCLPLPILDRELEAVMAHELGHVKNYDIRVMMIVFGLVSAIGLIADLFLRMMWFGGSDVLISGTDCAVV